MLVASTYSPLCAKDFGYYKRELLFVKFHRKCVSCRKRNEAPMQQLMADLPKERLIPFEPPFTYTGAAFFGPFHVKRGRRTEKVYGCLFTCFTSRAVHIKDVSSLDTDSFKVYFKSWLSKRNMER